MAGKAVAKAETKEVAAFDASMFEQDAGQGMDNLSQEDLALPFLKILSGLDSVLDTHETARKGDIYNTVTGDAFAGKDGIRVVPCAYQRRFIRWAPRGEGSGGPVAIYAPGDDIPKTQRGEDFKDYVADGSGDYIEETHQHFVLMLGDDGMNETALITMKSTQLKKSRKWNSMMASRTMKGKNGPFTPPRFSHVYRMKTVSEENSKGSWHGWEISLDGPVKDSDTYIRSRSFAESVTTGDVNVKHSNDSSGESDDSVPF